MFLVGAGVAAVVTGLLVAAGLYGFEQMTRPARWSVEDTAERWGLPVPRGVRFAAPDGLSVAGWWFHSDRAVGTIVVCHGHGGNKASNLWVASGLYPTYNVLLIDSRGHGESGGDRTTVGYLERLDVVGAARWARCEAPRLPIGVIGISMGAAAAILAAAECEDIAAVVADSPFARLRTPVRLAIRQRGYPAVLVPLLSWVIIAATGLRLGIRREWRDPLDVVHRIAPRRLFIVHGDADDMIPPSEAKVLLAAAGGLAKLWLVPGAGHARAAEVADALYGSRVREFLAAALAVPAPADAAA